MIKVSVIMPVYNAQAFLKRAIDSIIAQTLNEWELIAVDDGSTDASGQILDEYASQDTRIRVIHQANSGVSMARQVGIDAAIGEYTIHADSDDWVEPTMLEELYHKAKEEDSDVVVCDYYVNDQKGQRLIKQQPTHLSSMQMLHDLFYRLHGSLWNKLIRHSCYAEYELRFYPGINYCEDFLIMAQLLKNEDIKISYLAQAYCHYCENEQSITRYYTRAIYKQRLQFITILKKILNCNEFVDDIIKMECDIYQEGLIAGVLDKEECRKNFGAFKKLLRKKGIRWRLFYQFSSMKLYQFAQFFVKK